MLGPEYANDSVGPAFDLEAMLAVRRAGTSVEELIGRAWSLHAGLQRSDVDFRRRMKNPTRSIPTFAEIGWRPTSFGRTTSTAVDIVEGIRAIGTAAAAPAES
jgi:hypothetical protein